MEHEKRASVELMHERYEYWENVPKPGLFIDGKPAITQIDKGMIGDYMLITVRDPLAAYGKDPAELIAERLDQPVLAGKSGMFTTYTGFYKGARISVCSGGSGSPEVELALNDFMEYTDCSTFIRVGSAGGVSEKAEIGDCIISSGVFREDGTSKAYIGHGFPAYCHYEVVTAMIQAARRLGKAHKLGVTACMDSDFVGNGRPSVGGYMQLWNIEKLGTYNRAGILCTDRESSIVMTMCNLFGRRGGAVFHITDNIITGGKFKEGSGTDDATELVLEGIALLHEMDMQKAAAGETLWNPDLVQGR